MLWTEIKYANLLAGKLDRFILKKTNPYLANFRCPLCGDSAMKKTKARGYIVAKKDRLKFYCHNCGAAMNFTHFLYNFDAALYKEFRLEDFREQRRDIPTNHEETFATPAPVFRPMEWKDNLVLVRDLPSSHFASQYLQSRAVSLDPFWFCEEFVAWGNRLLPGKLENMPEHPRLILPLLSRDNQAFGFCTRSFSNEKHDRYITLMLPNAPFPKVFGLDRLNEKAAEDVFVLEGPIDSLFVENAIAMIGTSLDVTQVLLEPMKAVYVYDNEPRNREILKLMEQCVRRGYRIFIWPDHIHEKDINEAVLAKSVTNTTLFLKQHVYSGVAAKLRLNNWRKD